MPDSGGANLNLRDLDVLPRGQQTPFNHVPSRRLLDGKGQSMWHLKQMLRGGLGE
jgi:hypothetical protein